MIATTDRKPDMEGPFASAWRLDMTNARAAAAARPGGNPDDATVAGWIVHAPHSHPIWPYVAVVCVHLRDMPHQTKPPTVHLEGASHEIIVLALNPATYPPLIDGDKLDFLRPSNFVGQFAVASDDEASAIVDVVIARICSGTLNPDTDGNSNWVALFGDHCFKPSYKHGIVGTINQKE